MICTNPIVPSLAGLVTECCYIDKIVLLMRDKPSQNLMEALRDSQKSVRGPIRSRTGGWRVPISQPDLEALAVLKQDWQIQRIEFALDLNCPYKHLTRRLGLWISDRLIHPNRGQNFSMTYEHAMYSTKQRGRGVQWCMYWDRPSRIHGGPTIHIELRINGVNRISRMGIGKVVFLSKLDIREYIRSKIKILEIDYIALGRQLARKQGLVCDAREAWYLGARFANAASRAAGAPRVQSQIVWDEAGNMGFNLRSIFKQPKPPRRSTLMFISPNRRITPNKTSRKKDGCPRELPFFFSPTCNKRRLRSR